MLKTVLPCRRHVPMPKEHMSKAWGSVTLCVLAAIERGAHLVSCSKHHCAAGHQCSQQDWQHVHQVASGRKAGACRCIACEYGGRRRSLRDADGLRSRCSVGNGCHRRFRLLGLVLFCVALLFRCCNSSRSWRGRGYGFGLCRRHRRGFRRRLLFRSGGWRRFGRRRGIWIGSRSGRRLGRWCGHRRRLVLAPQRCCASSAVFSHHGCVLVSKSSSMSALAVRQPLPFTQMHKDTTGQFGYYEHANFSHRGASPGEAA